MTSVYGISPNAGQYTRFGSSGPNAQGAGVDPHLAANYRRLQEDLQDAEDDIAKHKKSLGTSDKVSSGLSVAALGGATLLAAAKLAGEASWFYGGLIPMGLVLIPLANRFVSGAKKTGDAIA